MPAKTRAARPHVAVVGVGAFGGWTAWHLASQGARVTLIDALGAGHRNTSSGGESRVIRMLYGPDRLYVDLVLRAWEGWRDAERRWDAKVLYETGVLWLFEGADDYVRSSLPVFEATGLSIDELSKQGLQTRFPQFRSDDVESAFFEPRSGFLLAQDATRRVAQTALQMGAESVVGRVIPIESSTDPGIGNQVEPAPDEDRECLNAVRLADGREVRADRFVIACGAWLPQVLPRTLGGLIRPTRQEVFFFEPPAGSTAFHHPNCPIWLTFGKRRFYSIPASNAHGVKISDDVRGVPIDPEADSRRHTESVRRDAEAALAHRLPHMAGAELIDSRVCVYENSLDGNLIVDRHPDWENVWIAGGGSGHGFKLGPAIGEELARAVLDGRSPPSEFRLDRLADIVPPADGTAQRSQFEVDRSEP